MSIDKDASGKLRPSATERLAIKEPAVRHSTCINPASMSRSHGCSQIGVK